MGKRARIENRIKRKETEKQRAQILTAMQYVAQLTLIMADRLELMTNEQRQELAERHALKKEYVDRPEKFRERYFGNFTPEERLISAEEATVENWLMDMDDWRNLLYSAGLSPNVTFAPEMKIDA
jgi:hypothetical protein